MNVNNYFELSDDFALTIRVGEEYTIDLIVSAYALDELQEQLNNFLKAQAGNVIDIDKQTVDLKKLNVSKMKSEKEIMFDIIYENPTNKKNINSVLKNLKDNQKKALKHFIGDYVMQSLQKEDKEAVGK